MLSAADITRINSRITNILQVYASVAPTRTSTLLPLKNLQGKLYEADVLALICEKLVTQEGYVIQLSGGSILTLKQKGSFINRSYPYFKIFKSGIFIAELFTDVYFNTLSYFMKGSPTKKINGDYHELDIALVQLGVHKEIRPEDIFLAVECKNTSIKKSIVREVLGFRRELAFYSHVPQPTIFSSWPSNQTNSDPNSIQMLFCSDHRINRYIINCQQFGIFLQHHIM